MRSQSKKENYMAAIGIITPQENVNLHNESQDQENVGYLPNNQSVCQLPKPGQKLLCIESCFSAITTFSYPDYITVAAVIGVLAKNKISRSPSRVVIEETVFAISIVTILTLLVRTVQLGLTNSGVLSDPCIYKSYEISLVKTMTVVVFLMMFIHGCSPKQGYRSSLSRTI